MSRRVPSCRNVGGAVLLESVRQAAFARPSSHLFSTFPAKGWPAVCGQSLRLRARRRNIPDGQGVLHPNLPSIPWVSRGWEGTLVSLGALPTFERFRRHCASALIGFRFGYPNGYASAPFGRRLSGRVTVTSTDNEGVIARNPTRFLLLARIPRHAARFFIVRGHASVTDRNAFITSLAPPRPQAGNRWRPGLS